MEKHLRERRQTFGKRQWQAHVKAMIQSGLSRAAYCRQQDLSYHALTYWQRKLEKAKTSAQSQALVPVTFQIEPDRQCSSGNRAGLHIILSSQLSIAVGDNFSAGTLNRLLAVLESR